MSRAPATGRLPRGRLRGSAAEDQLRPPRTPARPLCTRQRRHLGAGSAGRAATGLREGQRSAARGGVRVRRALRSRGVRLRGAARATGVWRAEVRSRAGRCRCGALDSAVPPYELPPGFQLSSEPRPHPRPDPLLTLTPAPSGPDPHRAPHCAADFPTLSPTSASPQVPRNPGKLFICVTNDSMGAGCAGEAGSSSSGHFFLATLSFPSISRWPCLLISAREGT